MKRCFYWPLVANQVFHVTSREFYQEILDSKKLLPSCPRRTSVFSQSSSSYAQKYGYVSLFDFESCSETKIGAMRRSWIGVLIKHKPTVLIRMNQCINNQIIPSSHLNDKFKDSAFMCENYHIPHVEAWYPTYLSIEGFMDVHEIDWDSQTITKLVVGTGIK